jgi:hypothetical protein
MHDSSEIKVRHSRFCGNWNYTYDFIADLQYNRQYGVSGIALDATGKMFFSVKRFANNDPSVAF